MSGIVSQYLLSLDKQLTIQILIQTECESFHSKDFPFHNLSEEIPRNFYYIQEWTNPTPFPPETPVTLPETKTLTLTNLKSNLHVNFYCTIFILSYKISLLPRPRSGSYTYISFTRSRVFSSHVPLILLFSCLKSRVKRVNRVKRSGMSRLRDKDLLSSL